MPAAEAGAGQPDVAVVVATRDRRDRLAALLDGLRRQTLERARFEAIVVDDGSVDGTTAMLEAERERGGLELRVLRLDRDGGPSRARNLGWREAGAATIAFTDDDCVPEPGWLAEGLAACAANPGAIVQGPTIPSRAEWERTPAPVRPFTQAMEVRGPDPHMQTCNVFYPRALLEELGGFDTDVFARNMAEDADLAWRAIEAGAETAFAPRAEVVHAINRLGPLGKLRRAASWDLVVYARHPGLRRAWFRRRFFWLGSHYLLCRALLAALLPRRHRALRAWLAVPYAVHLLERGRHDGGGPLFAPWFFLHDLVELAAALRSSIRHRVPML